MKLVVALVLFCCCLCCSMRSTQSLITNRGVLRQVVQESILPPEERSDFEPYNDWVHAQPYDERSPTHDRSDRGGREKRDYHHRSDEPYEEEQPRHRHRHYEGPERSPFVLEKPLRVIRTEAGELRALPRDRKSELARRNIALKLLTLEPKALLLPQYTDGNSVFLVYAGKATLSFVESGNLREIQMEDGDIYRLEGGRLFYILNKDEGQRLKIFSILDTSNAFNDENIPNNFYVAGGEDPKTVLSGFDEDVLASAFQVSSEEVRDVLSSQTQGPIFYPSVDNDTKEGPQSQSSFMQITTEISNLFGDSSTKPFNILKKNPDVRNEYGWSSTVDEKDFDMLRKVDRGVFAVSLKAGALMAPHWNPRATEIGLVTKGEGEIQIAFPNGTAAARERVVEGTVFFIPQYFPMCQIAARSGPFEFMGFSTCSRRNHPQFLSGSNSVLKAVNPDILAAAFDISRNHLTHFFESQTKAIILPGQQAEKPDHRPEFNFLRHP